MPKRCCLVVGHRLSSPGAVVPHAYEGGGVSEYEYNSEIARHVIAGTCGVEVLRVERDDSPGGYKRLPRQINALRPDFIISLHFNSVASPRATGTETLYWRDSLRGELLASEVQDRVLHALGLVSRGTKSRYGRYVNSQWVGDRGSYLLGRTSAPCVIAEPFFGSNESDWRAATERKSRLAIAYSRAIKSFAATLD